MAWNSNWLELWLAPELSLVDSHKDRAGLYRSALRGLGGKYILVMILAAVAGQFADRLVIRRLNLGWFLESLLWGICYFGLIVLGIWLFRREIRQRVRRDLNARGLHVCLGCAYLLEGLVEPRCPECGREFDPELVPALRITAAAPSEPRAPASGPRTTA